MVLHHSVTGSGPALLLLHSTAADSRQWDEQRAGLSRDRTVITPDLRGYGGSPLPPGAFTHADDVLNLLDHLSVDRTALVGSSGGGAVALAVAASAPDRVNALVLLCSAAAGVQPTQDLREFWARENKLLEAGDLDGATELNVRTWLGPAADDDARKSLRVMQAQAFRVQSAADDDAREDDPDVDLGRITAPTTVVHGRHDFDFFADVARHLAARTPAGEPIELDWAGHLPNLERPADITSLIRRSI